MPYATPTDMLARYGEAHLAQLCDRGQAQQSVVDSELLATALGDATALIEGYLVARYALPMNPVPSVLQVWCCKIARYQLMTHEPSEQATKEYELALKFLGLVSEGKVSITAPSAAPAIAGAGSVVFASGEKVFGREVFGREA
jgi:phage gp36-like protein